MRWAGPPRRRQTSTGVDSAGGQNSTSVTMFWRKHKAGRGELKQNDGLMCEPRCIRTQGRMATDQPESKETRGQEAHLLKEVGRQEKYVCGRRENLGGSQVAHTLVRKLRAGHHLQDVERREINGVAQHVQLYRVHFETEAKVGPGQC